MRTIWKYELEVTDLQVIRTPTDFHPLAVQVQNNKPIIWGIVTPQHNSWRTIRIITVGTGHEVPYDIRTEHYVGSYQLHSGAFIGHVFITDLCGTTEA